MVQSGKIRGLGLRDRGSNPRSPILNKMPTKLKKTKSAGRFGPRYGKKVRAKLVKVESEQRKKQKCPFCNKVGLKRLSNGIWQCSKCDKKFAGDTYKITE